MKFNNEYFEMALKANKIVRYQKHFEAVVKSYLEAETEQCNITDVGRMLAVSFAKWLRDNTIADGAPKLLFRPDMKRYTIEELFDLYTLIAE